MKAFFKPYDDTLHENEDLMSFEARRESVRRLKLENEFTTPSLLRLRLDMRKHEQREGWSLSYEDTPVDLKTVTANVQDLILDAENAGAIFQAASQFNCLENVSPDVGPRDGVNCYVYDHTQGPAVALTSPTALLYRNYIAQSPDHQIDLLRDLKRKLSHDLAVLPDSLWTMRNGWLMPGRNWARANDHIKSIQYHRDDYQNLLNTIRIGAHHAPIFNGVKSYKVWQVYTSALNMTTDTHATFRDRLASRPMAFLILRGMYEALLAFTQVQSPDSELFLTDIGAGAFCNPQEWVSEAKSQAVAKYGRGLKVRKVQRG